MGTKRIKSFKYVIVSVVAILLIAAILLGIAMYENRFGLFPEAEQKENTLVYNGKEYQLRDNVESFLLIGLDKYEENTEADSYNNDQQADFLMLVVFDNEAKSYSTIHINRDTMAEMEILGVGGNKVGTVKKQIALAHTYGNGGAVSNSNTVRAVSKLLCGIKIDHYMALTLDSVGAVNNLVGGVTLEVLDDFTGIEGGENLKKGETVKLTDKEALLYVQGRKGLEDSSNVERMKRQKQFLDSMRSELENRIETDNEFLADVVTEMSKYMTSDCSATRLQDIGERMKTYNFVEIKDIEGEAKVSSDRRLEFYPDESSIKGVVVDLFYVPKK